MRQFFGKKSRNALVTVLMVSLGLHIVAIAIFGLIKFAEILREEPVFQAAHIEPPPVVEPKDTRNLEQETKDAPPPSPPVFIVNNPSELSIPPIDFDVDVDSSSVISRRGKGFGDGIGDIRKSSINVAKIFNKPIEANQR